MRMSAPRSFEQLDAEVRGRPRPSSCGTTSAALCGTALKSVLRQPTSAVSGCSMPMRSRSLTSCTSQGRPQLVLFVPGERTAQNTQCSMWNIGMCWWIDDFQPLGRHGGDQVEQLLAVQVVRRP